VPVSARATPASNINGNARDKNFITVSSIAGLRFQ
jgi:hypothetical protein